MTGSHRPLETPVSWDAEAVADPGTWTVEPSRGHVAELVAATASARAKHERPDLAAELYQPLPYDVRGEEPQGAKGWYEIPAFTELDGRLFARTIRPYVDASQRHADAPRPSALQREAIEAFDTLITDPSNRVEMDFAPGDAQLINNYHVLHGPTELVDHEEPERKRLLRRLWLDTSYFGPGQRPEWFQNHADHWAARGRTRAG
jgi:hypothetical protein